ncbi:50S ribosomal protein L11 methyltransferase [Candidatus Poribacteria bacterium]|nr:MAG: 50S ribosomal protein L11 methyltransferase [Candidatus Poribacteria bacterium]
MHWAQLTITTSQEAAEAVANYLFELKARGVEFKDCPASTTRIIAYYPLDDSVGAKVQQLRDFLAQFPAWGITPQPAQVSLKQVESEAWEEAWKAVFPPQRIGKRFLIAPTWEDIAPAEADILIRLDPGMAFGTGYHPTTRLSLELLEDAVKPNHYVADIGTGSGILAIAAVKLGAKHVDAIELDATAIPVAASNFRKNGVNTQVRLLQGDGLKAQQGTYHVIVGNILTKVLLPLIPDCASRLHSEGHVIFSGILETELRQVKSVLEARGFQCLQVALEAEDDITWVAVLARRLF